MNQYASNSDVMEALKEAIQKYRGTVILVSHEPEFYRDLVTRVINAEEYTLKVL